MQTEKQTSLLILLLSIIIWLALAFCCMKTYAQDFYYGHAEGWHWYKNAIEKEKELEQKKSQQINPTIKPMKQTKQTFS